MKLEIDYASHPAFASIASGRRSIEAQRYFEQIDALWRDLASERKGLSVQSAATAFDRETAPLMAALKEKLAGMSIAADYLPFVQRALDDSLSAIRAEIAQVKLTMQRPKQ